MGMFASREKSKYLPPRAIGGYSSVSLNEVVNENTIIHGEGKIWCSGIAKAIEKLNKAFGSKDRYGHDVPCVRPLREICAKLKVQLNGEYGSLSRILKNLKREKLPGHRKILESMETLRRAVDSVVAEEEDYVAKLEDIRQAVGELAGITQAMIKLQF